MKVQSLVQAQANVIRVTNLTAGTILKIYNKDNYGENKMVFGIVKEILNSGDNVFINIFTVLKEYNDVKAKIITYQSNDDLQLFPATIEEVKTHLAENLDEAERTLIRKRTQLKEEERAFKEMKSFIHGEMGKKLTEASFEEMTQKEYSQKALQGFLNEIPDETPL